MRPSLLCGLRLTTGRRISLTGKNALRAASTGPATRGRASAFTLIELLIVVAMISILMAIVTPFLLRARRESQPGNRPETSIAQAPPTARMVVPEGQPPAQTPCVESTDVRVILRVAHVIEAYAVLTLYTAEFTGKFVIRNLDPKANQVYLRFPFPAGMTEATNVSLQMPGPNGRLEESPATAYSTQGIEWKGQVAPGQSLTAVVAYSVQGREAFVYDIGAAERSGSVQVEIDLDDARDAVVPAESLQPTTREDGRLAWSAAKLVTSRPIQVKLPGTESPLGRIILLCQLAGLAVLLFGGGFWYLNEWRKPGGLDDFRLGHFLLLALNYSLFFAIFAIVGYDRGSGIALGVASALGLPLLTIHVARITEWRFALARILPLTALTLATVITAVYFPNRQAYLFLGCAILVIGFITLTYRGWSSGRKAHAEEVIRSREREAQARRQGLVVANQDQHGTPVGTVHCASCGIASAGAGVYCPRCGTPLPLRIACGRCGQNMTLPPHLMVERWKTKPLCCPACGIAIET